MTKRLEHYTVRLPNGVIVKMTATELWGSEHGLKLHIVKRRKATFLPGVNPKWDMANPEPPEPKFQWTPEQKAKHAEGRREYQRLKNEGWF